MSASRPCVCCANEALPGRLLCSVCRGHAAELERIRLTLPARPRLGVAAKLAIMLALTACGGPSHIPCDAHDRAAQVDLAAELADCTARIEACTTSACIDPIEAECNAYAAKRCPEPSK